MDSTEFNKIAGGLIGAFLLFLLLNFASNKIYGTGEGAHHGDEPLAFALAVEEEADDSAAKPEPEPTDYAALVANADVANGEKIYRKCQACHKVEDGQNGVGPHLYGVVGRDIAAVDGFGYSGALTDLEGDWNLVSLSGFLKNPKEYATGTKMAFAGLKDDQDRVDLIAYLNEADGTPIELAAAPATDGDAKPADDAAAADGGDAKPADDAAATDGDDAKPADDAAATDGDDAKPADDAVATGGDDAKPADDAKPVDDAAAADDGEKTEVAAADAAEDEDGGVGETAAAFAGGDAKAGEKVYRKCRVCHKVEDGKNGVGPHLWGVINRDIASVEGYNYSATLSGMSGKWTATELSKFLADPKGYAKGTKMSFGGLKKDKEILDVITYLNEADGSPAPLQ